MKSANVESIDGITKFDNWAITQFKDSNENCVDAWDRFCLGLWLSRWFLDRFDCFFFNWSFYNWLWILNNWFWLWSWYLYNWFGFWNICFLNWFWNWSLYNWFLSFLNWNRSSWLNSLFDWYW